MKAPLLFGVIGLGNWGQQHVSQLKGLPSVEVCWVGDVDAVLAEGTAHWNGIPYCIAEWSDMLAALQLNAVCVVTREHAYLGAVQAVVAAGKPVCIGTPVVSTDDEAEAMLAAAAEASSSIMSSHVMCLDPGGW